MPDSKPVEAMGEVELSERQIVALVQAIDVSSPQWKIRNESLRLKDVLMDALSVLRSSGGREQPEGDAYATLRDRMDELAMTAGPDQTWEDLYKQLRHELNVAGQGDASALREQPAGLREALMELRDACAHCLAASRPPNEQMVSNADQALALASPDQESDHAS